MPALDLTPVNFVVHDAAGTILRYGTCPRAYVAQQAATFAETALETAMPAPGDFFRIENGAPVPIN